MASTPSSSALSAVLRCRGNIWARNPPTRRPATPASSLGPAGREGRSRARPWEAFLRGERVLFGRTPAAAVRTYREDGKGSGETRKLCHSELPPTSGEEALVRRLARRLTSHLPGIDMTSKINEVIKYSTCATYVCKIVFVRDAGELSPRVLLVSVTSGRLTENSGPVPPLVITGWSMVKSACLSLAALVSQFVFVRLQGSRHYGSPAGSQRLRSRRGDVTIRSDAAQASGRTHTPSGRDPSQGSPSCSQRVTEDRPD